MQLRWTEQAADDLEAITNYLFENTPEHAERIVRTIYNAPASLREFPSRGRPGRKEGTRELVLLPLPYVVVYQVAGEIIHVVRILHSAQNWP
jgi:toxin ParE1/3/4